MGSENHTMDDEKLMDLKMKAILAATECADKIGISTDRARMILEATWEVIEPELTKSIFLFLDSF